MFWNVVARRTMALVCSKHLLGEEVNEQQLGAGSHLSLY